MNMWRPASNGAGKRHWFVCRERLRGVDGEYHFNSRGDLIRYATHEAAQRAADRLNASEIDLWGIRTTSSGAFPEARREKNKLRGARKVC